jgi:flagellar protein FliS
MSQSNDLSYRKSAIEGASPIGLVIALYDTLWGDLRRAAVAIRENDIERRCRELNHAALVLGQLESWIDLKNGGELAKNLTQLYAYLRAKMMEASIAKSAPMLEAQMELILHVRTSWQQRDMVVTPTSANDNVQATANVATPDANRVAFSWSA